MRLAFVVGDAKLLVWGGIICAFLMHLTVSEGDR